MDRQKFGFGCMRLPLLDKEKPDSFDFPRIEELFDAFLAKGFTYFDTAYTYHGYECEKAVKKALVQRHPRHAFQLATKLPLRDFKDAADMEAIFAEQLANCGVEHFDFYLLHNMGHNVWEKCRKYGAFDFVRRKKAEGRIRSAGMSFHDTPELLDKVLAEFGSCIDFVQLQINYVDMDQPNVRGRECLAVASRYGKPVTVMEPCKGGTLINVPQASPASWALRFAAGQPGVTRVLSGMNSLAQIEENCACFTPFKPLSSEENAIVQKVAAIITANTAIACTACGYCTHGCPKRIAIPQYFAAYNSIMQTTGSFSSQQVYYNNTALAGHGKAGECVRCGKCEQTCPQHLPIREWLENVAEKFEKGGFFPTRASKR